jgi:small subunit ribosomal protein S23e
LLISSSSFLLYHSKANGIGAARKLRVKRRWNRWADKAYKKSHLTVSIKAHAFGGTSMARGIVVEKM